MDAEDAAIALEEAGEKEPRQLMGHRVCEVLHSAFLTRLDYSQGRIFACTWNTSTNIIVTGSEDGTVLHSTLKNDPECCLKGEAVGPRHTRDQKDAAWSQSA